MNSVCMGEFQKCWEMFKTHPDFIFGFGFCRSMSWKQRTMKQRRRLGWKITIFNGSMRRLLATCRLARKTCYDFCCILVYLTVKWRNERQGSICVVLLATDFEACFIHLYFHLFSTTECVFHEKILYEISCSNSSSCLRSSAGLLEEI